MRTAMEDWAFGCGRKFTLGDDRDVVDLGTGLDAHRDTVIGFAFTKSPMTAAIWHC